MVDVLAQIVNLLQPSAARSKVVTACGTWQVTRSDNGHPFYCALLEGACQLVVAGQQAITLAPGDFVLVPAAYDFTNSSLPPPLGHHVSPPAEIRPGVIEIGDTTQPVTARLIVGHCAFAVPETDLLISLLPGLVHVPGDGKLATLVEQIDAETKTEEPGRDLVLTRLVEVLLIKALRSTSVQSALPGLLRGLADPRIAIALRQMHGQPSEAWSVISLAREAGLSRSVFFTRFRREVGVTPMDYLSSWRMTLARDLLRQGRLSVAAVAEAVGYPSASTFSTAFARRNGVPPIAFAREHRRLGILPGFTSPPRHSTRKKEAAVRSHSLSPGSNR